MKKSLKAYFQTMMLEYGKILEMNGRTWRF